MGWFEIKDRRYTTAEPCPDGACSIADAGAWWFYAGWLLGQISQYSITRKRKIEYADVYSDWAVLKPGDSDVEGEYYVSLIQNVVIGRVLGLARKWGVSIKVTGEFEGEPALPPPGNSAIAPDVSAWRRFTDALFNVVESGGKVASWVPKLVFAFLALQFMSTIKALSGSRRT